MFNNTNFVCIDVYWFCRLLAAEIFSENRLGDFITRSPSLLNYDLANVFSEVGI